MSAMGLQIHTFQGHVDELLIYNNFLAIGMNVVMGEKGISPIQQNCIIT